MSVGAIPWSAINAYAHETGVLAKARFHKLIRRVDETYLSELHKRAESDDA